MKNATRVSRLTALALALSLMTLAGCAARSGSGKTPGTPTAEAEPIHDTIQEFRKGERIACAQGTDLVYVVSRDGGLHSFDPSELRFRRIGTLECPGTRRSRPHSMAVDRSGQAWVGYDNGVVAHASITSAECTASSINVHSARIGRTFGMGFAPTPEGGIGGETLFLTSEPSTFQEWDESAGSFQPQNFRHGALARIDDGTNIRIAGEFPPSLRGLRGELSSRSDGRLFAFFTGDPFQLAEIDPATADVRWQKKLEGMRFSETGTGSWAFAAVGSEFFFFWADRSGPSKVTRLREDGTLEHVILNAGMEIVGAGASTCAARSAKSTALPSGGVATEDSTEPSEPIVKAPASPAPPAPPPPPSPPPPTPSAKSPPGSKTNKTPPGVLPPLPPLPPPNPAPKKIPSKKPPTKPRPLPPSLSTRS